MFKIKNSLKHFSYRIACVRYINFAKSVLLLRGHPISIYWQRSSYDIQRGCPFLYELLMGQT